MMLVKMKEEKKFAEDKEDFDLAAALKDTISACTTLSEQIWVCSLTLYISRVTAVGDQY